MSRYKPRIVYLPQNRKRMLLRYFVAPSILLELDEEQRIESALLKRRWGLI